MYDTAGALGITRSQERDIRLYMPSDGDVRIIAGFFSVFFHKAATAPQIIFSTRFQFQDTHYIHPTY